MVGGVNGWLYGLGDVNNVGFITVVGRGSNYPCMDAKEEDKER